MSTTYLVSFGADLSENELFKCVRLLILATSNIGCVFNITPYKVLSTQYFISELKIPQNERCGECLTKLKNYPTYNEPPKLLILEYPYTSIKTSLGLTLYSLKGAKPGPRSRNKKKGKSLRLGSLDLYTTKTG